LQSVGMNKFGSKKLERRTEKSSNIVPESMADDPNAPDLWREKLEVIRAAEVLAVDAAEKFQIKRKLRQRLQA
jgi:hypothetical protein